MEKTSLERNEIYFDCAATSLQKPGSVGQAILHALGSFGGAGRGGHEAALNSSRCIYKARQKIAKLLGSSPERTVFTSNATQSLNIAINGLLSPEDHVITTALEHNSVLRPLYRLREKGMGLSVVELGSDGTLNYEEFSKNLCQNTRAVVCTHGSNLTGEIVDLGFLSEFCMENNLLLIVDASQTAGVFPIDADGLGIDALCFTGHKGLLGPQGTGGICIGESVNISPLIVGGSGVHSFLETHPTELPEALEAGTLNAHGIAGLLAGIEYIFDVGMDNIRCKELKLAEKFLAGVSDIKGVRILGNPNVIHAPIVSLNIAKMDSGEVGDQLSEKYGIMVRAGAHCAPLAHIALGSKEQGAVRFSFSSFNTEDEVQTAINSIRDIVEKK